MSTEIQEGQEREKDSDIAPSSFQEGSQSLVPCLLLNAAEVYGKREQDSRAKEKKRGISIGLKLESIKLHRIVRVVGRLRVVSVGTSGSRLRRSSS